MEREGQEKVGGCMDEFEDAREAEEVVRVLVLELRVEEGWEVEEDFEKKPIVRRKGEGGVLSRGEAAGAPQLDRRTEVCDRLLPWCRGQVRCEIIDAGAGFGY